MAILRHIVLLKLRANLPLGKVESLLAGIDEMLAKVPGVVHYSRGPHDSHIGLNRGFNHGLTIDFDTVEHRDAYHADPANRIPVDALAEVFDGSFDEAVLALDYWLERPR